jgi:hypothetical protein
MACARLHGRRRALVCSQAGAMRPVGGSGVIGGSRARPIVDRRRRGIEVLETAARILRSVQSRGIYSATRRAIREANA